MKRKILAVSIVFLMALSASAFGVQQVIWGGGGYLGVSLRDVTSEDVLDLGLDKEVGVFIEQVVEESPAAEAGIQEGDVVLEYSGVPVMSVRQFQRVVSETPPGRKVTMTVWRAGTRTELTAEIKAKKGIYTLAKNFPPEVDKKDFDYEVTPDLEDFVMRFEPGYRALAISRGPQLGIHATTLTAQMADFLGVSQEEGALVMEVLEDTPAEKAGLRAGDVITAIDGKTIDSPKELKNHLSKEKHQIEIVRNRSIETLTIDLETQKVKIKKKTTGQSLRM